MARNAKYIKIPVDFFQSEPVMGIEYIYGKDSDSVILLYLELLCEAYKKEPFGVFKVAEIDLTDDLLSSVFDYDDIGHKLSVLERFGLIKRNPKSVQVFKYWQDKKDRRDSLWYKNWRTAVFERDNFKCQKCGTHKNIQAHHIKTWKNNKELRYAVSNGVTLCRKCHLEAHGGCWKNGE